VSAARPRCARGFDFTATASGVDPTRTYQWRGAVPGAGPVQSATFEATTDPFTSTTTISSATSTLPIAETMATVELWDTTADPEAMVATTQVTLPACDEVSGTLAPGESLSSDPENTAPSSSNPVVTTVTSPAAGDVTIAKGSASGAVAGWSTMGVHVDVTAPAATSTKPLKVTFAVFAPAMPSGRYVSDLGVFRNGTLVAECLGSVVASPDPCVSATRYVGTTVTFTVLASAAGSWDVMAAKLGRLAGADRYSTAIQISKAQFADKGASAVVLATGTDYPDALVAAPLAKATNAPLLLTSGTVLRSNVRAELRRVAAPGTTVYLVGGARAVPQSVATQLAGLGYSVTRVAGTDRFATAAAVAELLGRPTTVLLATGTDFPDALAAGVAASQSGAVVLLTNGTRLPPATSSYLTGATTVYAVGGPAAAAAPASATELVGASRFETALVVAERFFPHPTSVGFATGLDFPDALSGGAMLARAGAPLVLTSRVNPNSAVTSYLTDVASTVTSAHLFGGTAVISSNAASTISTALGLS
jgi:putative cell wall-binding protein